MQEIIREPSLAPSDDLLSDVPALFAQSLPSARSIRRNLSGSSVASAHREPDQFPSRRSGLTYR
jgi:hypothetical protein